jgi:hypothetical protein
MSELTEAVELLEGRQAAIMHGFSVHLGERLSADPASVERAADTYIGQRVYLELLTGMDVSAELVGEMLDRARREARTMAAEISGVAPTSELLVEALAAMYRCGFCEAIAIGHARAERDDQRVRNNRHSSGPDPKGRTTDHD